MNVLVVLVISIKDVQMSREAFGVIVSWDFTWIPLRTPVLVSFTDFIFITILIAFKNIKNLSNKFQLQT